MPGYKLLLLSFLSYGCFAQPVAEWKEKALYKELLYLNHPFYGSHNPVSISEMPRDIAVFDATYSSALGEYKLIRQGQEERNRTGSISGVRKIGGLSFEGAIEYASLALVDKKWGSHLWVSEDNPFYISDSIPGNSGVETFRLNGGFSYRVSERWRAALRATYLAGTLADQTDPRPLTTGMRFVINPGIDYRLGTSFSVGISGRFGRLGESTEYTVINSIEPNVNTLFLFKGLGSPELKSALGYKRSYEGNEYGGAIQLAWDGTSGVGNFLEASSGRINEYANDGDSGFDYKGGDYQATFYRLSERLSLKTPAYIHSFTADFESRSVDGIWYIQTQSTDADANVVWTVRDRSVSHKQSETLTGFGYQIDRMDGNIPRFTALVSGTYAHSVTHQYPELYRAEYNLITYSGQVSGHLNLWKGMLSLSARFSWATSPLQEIETGGSRLSAAFTEPAFQAVSGSHYACGIDFDYRRPLSLSTYSFLIGLRAGGTSKQYQGQAEIYQNASRQSFSLSLYLTF
ncbi:MAG: hypothetical protein LBH58_14590 [Tannerellaceae bacterium]|jgi:hypothetical protein|nr:hypothetical protein [Tannerellaceae bacterium]